MNITDVVMKSRNVESFNNLLPVTSVTSEKSKAVASRNGYMAPYTADELRKKFHLTDDIIENLYYGCGLPRFITGIRIRSYSPATVLQWQPTVKIKRLKSEGLLSN